MFYQEQGGLLMTIVARLSAVVSFVDGQSPPQRCAIRTNLYARLPHVVIGPKFSRTLGIALLPDQDGLYRKSHTDFGEFPFHALR
jgi:hypothetical protein